MADALAAKNAEIEALVNSVDGLKRQAALSEGNLASLQVCLPGCAAGTDLFSAIFSFYMVTNELPKIGTYVWQITFPCAAYV